MEYRIDRLKIHLLAIQRCLSLTAQGDTHTHFPTIIRESTLNNVRPSTHNYFQKYFSMFFFQAGMGARGGVGGNGGSKAELLVIVA